MQNAASSPCSPENKRGHKNADNRQVDFNRPRHHGDRRNPVHMGAVIITTLAFGLITPPYGLCLLMAAKFVGIKFSRAMITSLPAPRRSRSLGLERQCVSRVDFPGSSPNTQH